MYSDDLNRSEKQKFIVLSSTLYTTLHYQKLKSRLANFKQKSFIHNNVYRRYKYLILGR